MRIKTFLSSLLLGLVSVTNSMQPASAVQECLPPNTGEYLLVIVSESPSSQSIVRNTVPPDINIVICRYLKNVVSSISGFDDQYVAEDWAKYLGEKTGLASYVIKPNPNITPIKPAEPFLPRNLDKGFAVIVDYNNQPAVLNQLERTLGRSVGLISYGQRVYLLVTYTPDKDVATSSLFNLSSRGFNTFIVDSSQVTILKSGI
jgi:hypothetical protein